jgi:Domain of unknown function (DUF6471)
MSMGFSTTPLVSRLQAADRDAEGNPKPAQHFHYLDRNPVQLLPATAGAVETQVRLTRKINRGNFPAGFFLQCMVAMGVTNLRLPERENEERKK